jgi:predicted permease
MFFQILTKISVLFVILFIGVIARRRKILTEDSTRALATLVIVIALPFLYFYSLATKLDVELLKIIWSLPLIAISLVFAAYAAAKFLSNFVGLDSRGKATFIYLATFTNCGFLAIPIANALYGTEGIVRVVFFNVGFNMLYWTLGVWTLRRSNPDSYSGNTNIFSSSKNLINSGTIGLLCGIAAGLAAIRLPYFILDSTKIIGSATIPLALLVVGSIMSRGEMQRLRTYKKALCLIILCRLIIIPALALIVTGLIGTLSPLSRAIIVLQSAMPSASTSPIFTTRFGGDSQLASAGVFATHICSIITIPIFMSLL